MEKQIGWYTVKEPTTFTNLFECAAWYEEVLIQPGKYELFADRLSAGRVALMPRFMEQSSATTSEQDFAEHR